MPAAAAAVYAFAALHPDRVSEQLGQALAAYFLSQQLISSPSSR